MARTYYRYQYTREIIYHHEKENWSKNRPLWHLPGYQEKSDYIPSKETFKQSSSSDMFIGAKTGLELTK